MNRNGKPRPVGRAGHFTLWEMSPGHYEIHDQRCPRAHAHVVWTGSVEDEGIQTAKILAANPPAFPFCK